MKVEGDYTCDICGESFETNVEIAGHVRAHQVSISAETIIHELQRLADEKGRPPTHSEVNNETEFTEGAVYSTFGGWDEGLEAAGLEPRTNGYCDTEIIEELHRVATQIGHSPSRNEWRELGGISAKAVQTHFGSWNEGLRAANLETTTQQTATEEDVIEAIQNLAAELGRPPKAKEMEQHGAWSVKVAQRCFGRWNCALRSAGFEPHKQWSVSEEQLHEEIERLADELGHVPSSIDMRDRGHYSVGSYARRYGTWQDAVEAAGFEYRGQPSGPDHPTWKGGYGDISYGPNWYKQRKRALERDGFECQMPGCPIDREAHRERWDRDLNVHHITPLGTFIDADGVLDYERANRLENLITLCQRHHMLWEEFAPLQPDIR
jgi:DNA-directed RNA polymerase specialized sigma subunit